MTRQSSCRLKSILGIVVAFGLGGSPPLAGDGNSILKQLKNISTISSIVPSNGDVTLGIYCVRANVDPRIIGVQEKYLPSVCFSSTPLTITTLGLILPFGWNTALQQRQPFSVRTYL